MEDQMEPNYNHFQDQQSNFDILSPLQIKNEVQQHESDNNIFETTIELPVSLPETTNQLTEIDDQMLSILDDCPQNEPSISNVNTTTKSEKESAESTMNDQLKSNSEQTCDQGFNSNAWPFMELHNNFKSDKPPELPLQNQVYPTWFTQSMTTYTPSIIRPQESSNQMPNSQSIFNSNAPQSSGIRTSIYTPSPSKISGQLQQFNDSSLPIFNNNTPNNYFSQSSGDNKRMQQSGFKPGFQRKMRRYFNEDHASHMRSTFNRIHRHTAVDFDLMTKVFNNLKAPYELPFTKEQVIECYDWYMGALQYNYVPGKRKQTPREKDRIALEEELGMVAAARKSADSEVICLD